MSVNQKALRKTFICYICYSFRHETFFIQIFKLKTEQEMCYFDWNIQKTLTEIGTKVGILISRPENFTGEL